VVDSKQSSKRLAKSTAKRRPALCRVRVAAHPSYRIVGLFKSGLHDLSENHDKYFINSLLRMPREENKVRLL